ncbi:hypothetical protein E5676_scaffold388G00920 [Cucumis melo var. makuwa]|uniref:Uncharacterized protein n=1 Tax=Cucumis melo var. makuwa TaxID=1194695 RepID=A0A5D3BSV0_CUCMM|nr:hypothetical protein E5676_scaffold388G00920 [Cucumis melo var. makuwa]
MKGRRVDFSPKAINALYGTKWDRIPTGKYQLFLHNLNIAVSVCERERDNMRAPNSWVRHPPGAKPFPQLIEYLCIKECLELEKFP